MKLFADDSSLFNRVLDVNITHSLLENDLTTPKLGSPMENGIQS